MRLVALLIVASGVFALAELAAEEPPAGRTVKVESVPQLERAVQQASAGDTILLADGTYHLERMLRVETSRLTLRGASGDRQAVVLDGSRSRHGELVGLFDCSEVTLADLTLQNVRHNGLKINSDIGDGVHRLTVSNCEFRNIWQRAIKSVRVTRPEQAPRDVVVRECRFLNERPKAFADDPDDRPGQAFDGNYVGGIDAMHAEGWTIADNVFEGIRGRTGSARAAIFLWVDSRDCVIERNVIVDCDRGIELGNASIPQHLKVHCTNMVVRDNRITRAPEGAITATYTRNCRIEGNVINDPQNRLRRSIRLVFDNAGMVVAENRIAGPPPRVESDDPSQVRLRDNEHGLDPSVLER